VSRRGGASVGRASRKGTKKCGAKWRRAPARARRPAAAQKPLSMGVRDRCARCQRRWACARRERAAPRRRHKRWPPDAPAPPAAPPAGSAACWACRTAASRAREWRPRGRAARATVTKKDDPPRGRAPRAPPPRTHHDYGDSVNFQRRALVAAHAGGPAERAVRGADVGLLNRAEKDALPAVDERLQQGDVAGVHVNIPCPDADRLGGGRGQRGRKGERVTKHCSAFCALDKRR